MSDETGMPQQPIQVNDIRSEYVYVANQRCPCGGDYAVVRQSLMLTAPPTDHLECRCRKCGQERAFVFDIGSFFGQ
ncbi:MAG: hypothetical protein SVX38_00340 [Chloroflexota bacterium]|nr:hypothetical protein [Chloroflexota bacterium]